MPFSPTDRPTPRQIAAAGGRTIPDVVGPGLKVLFCGINPGLYSAAIGHHFARPGNRFWPTLHAAGITDRLLTAWEDATLLERGCGLTNLVARATATIKGVRPEVEIDRITAVQEDGEVTAWRVKVRVSFAVQERIHE